MNYEYDRDCRKPKQKPLTDKRKEVEIDDANRLEAMYTATQAQCTAY